MRSEGVGRMLLYTPEGHLFPGFDNVVFAKQSAEKLASVGDLCDAGMVCIFDSDGLKTYKKGGCVITGSVFTNDKRDAKTSLYPLTLYRKVAEKSINVPTFSSLAIEQKKAHSTHSEKVSPEKLPGFIQDGESLPTALLARTYIKEGLSEVDRYHAKCGDIGIKYLKRAFPSLKVPAQYRCEFSETSPGNFTLNCVPATEKGGDFFRCRRAFWPAAAVVSLSVLDPYIMASPLGPCGGPGFLWLPS